MVKLNHVAKRQSMGFFKWIVLYGSGRMVDKEIRPRTQFFINKIPKLVNMREMSNFKPDISC